MPLRKSIDDDYWPRYPLVSLTSPPQDGPAQNAISVAPAKAGALRSQSQTAAERTRRTLSGRPPSRSVSSATSRRDSLRAPSSQRQHPMVRAHLTRNERICPFELAGRQLTAREQHLLDAVHADAKRIAGAADWGTSLLQAASLFELEIDKKQHDAQLGSAAFAQLLRQDCMSLFFERLSHMHGLCDRATLQAWVAMWHAWCQTPPPPACVGLVWVQYMGLHQAATSADACRQLDLLSGFLAQQAHEPTSFDVAWSGSDEAKRVQSRLEQSFANWQPRWHKHLAQAPHQQDNQNLAQRMAAVQARIEALKT